MLNDAPVDGCVFGLKGRNSTAQSNALGVECSNPRSPEGAQHSTSRVSPFQGFGLFRATDPGRCPGLSSCDPLGQSARRDPLFRVPHARVPHDRAGFSLLEMFVAVVVFGTVLMTFLPLMQSVGTQQRMNDQRLLALREANNMLEQLSQRKWNELTADEMAKVTLPDDVKSRLPQAALQIDLSEPAEKPPSKRVAVKLSWTPRSGQAAQSVQLAAWFFQTEGQP